MKLTSMENEMKMLAVITARGGSKRIPRKNIKEFFGRPMLQYAVDAALESKLFDTVMVSTDDEEDWKMAEMKYKLNLPHIIILYYWYYNTRQAGR